MATATKTATKSVSSPITPTAGTDPRRSPLASPTAEHKTNPLDSVVASSPVAVASSSPGAKSKDASVPESAGADDDDDDESSETIINMETFDQILELEEDDTYEFSIGMVQAYLQQAKGTFADMDAALTAKQLKKLSDLGHFLKGSSAALGVNKVQSSCEKMQQYGKCREVNGEDKISEEVALRRITKLLGRVKTEFAEAEAYLKQWYKKNGAEL